MIYPSHIGSLIEGNEQNAGESIQKINPATGHVLSDIYCATHDDVDRAVTAANKSAWRTFSIQERAGILKKACENMLAHKDEIAESLSLESGRSKISAKKEVEAAAECGLFLVSHVEVFDDETLHSTVSGRTLVLRKYPLGVGVLITPYNNPLVGIAWKLFPALLCGNSIVIKAHELAPYVPHIISKMLIVAGVPTNTIAVVEGEALAGIDLVENKKVSFVSFTGSSKVAADILTKSAGRLLRVSVESGGKNPFIVCSDADLDRAVSLAVKSSFIDAGQRCAAASRIIVLDNVYDEFKKKFLEKVTRLKIGTDDIDDYGAIISEKRLNDILYDIHTAQLEGAHCIYGGHRIPRDGFFLEPTVFEGADPQSTLSQKEIFGPVVALYRVHTFKEAIDFANNSQYFLTSAIHTRSKELASQFVHEYRGGVVRVNGPTFGSEPHVPFGGEGLSGNGWREPGLAALHFYSNTKQVSTDIE